MSGGSLYAGTWIDTFGNQVPSRPGASMRTRLLTQCASAHSCASASSTAMTPIMPMTSRLPISTEVSVRYCCV